MVQVSGACYPNGDLGDTPETFDPATSQWTVVKKSQVEVNLPPGGGRLVRVVTPTGGN